MSAGALVPFRHMLGIYVGVCGAPEVADSLSDHFGPHNAAFSIRQHFEYREQVQAAFMPCFLFVPEEIIRFTEKLIHPKLIHYHFSVHVQ